MDELHGKADEELDEQVEHDVTPPGVDQHVREEAPDLLLRMTESQRQEAWVWVPTQTHVPTGSQTKRRRNNHTAVQE